MGLILWPQLVLGQLCEAQAQPRHVIQIQGLARAQACIIRKTTLGFLIHVWVFIASIARAHVCMSKPGCGMLKGICC